VVGVATPLMLAYYSTTAHADFWTEHWGGHSVAELLAVARRSPLTELIVNALPPTGVVLEAGCGLGQYVILLRERGWRAAGVDGSLEALAACRRVAKVPLAAADLRALAIRTGALGAYVSLGVAEHDPDGPDAILAEARRVLAPGGTLVLSVPYVNGLRRLAAPWLRRRAQAVAAAGGAFYQYAFSRAELLAALARHGFVPTAAHPYDPARILRRLLPRAASGVTAHAANAAPIHAAGAAPARADTAPAAAAAPAMGERAGRRPGGSGAPASLRRLARQALYTEPALRLLGHMLLVVARRA
jgi:SAM-dependent methyltransferase